METWYGETGTWYVLFELQLNFTQNIYQTYRKFDPIWCIEFLAFNLYLYIAKKKINFFFSNILTLPNDRHEGFLRRQISWNSPLLASYPHFWEKTFAECMIKFLFHIKCNKLVTSAVLCDLEPRFYFECLYLLLFPVRQLK